MKKQISGLYLVIVVLIVAWIYKAFVPPPPRICGTEGGPPITAPRITLRDGRHLAYNESGVPKEKAHFKIIFVHGYGGSRNDSDFLVKILPQVYKEGLSVYLVSYDRPGYGESDPHPERTTRSMALDVADLADQLNLGDKFYLMSYSLGGQTAWSCLNYIPHRLAGAALLAPAINFWWENFSAKISDDEFRRQPLKDQWAETVYHYTPWLTYWWNTQTLFPSFSRLPNKTEPSINLQQGFYESLYRDLIVVFGSWGFSPPDIAQPSKTGTFQLWAGDADAIVPVTMQRYIAHSLPWIQYHEIRGGDHDFGYTTTERTIWILRCFLLGGNECKKEKLDVA